MGIPVPTKTNKRSDKLPSLPLSPPPSKPYMRQSRMHMKRDDPPEYMDDILRSASFPSYKDDFKRPPEVSKGPSDGSRMGNYFNIVIAPPPIKALQPRKLLGNNFSPIKRS